MERKLHNFEQVKDVLDYGIELHSQLRLLYRTLGRESGQERVRMLLDYLGRHERSRAEAMKRFEQTPHGGTLDVWLQYAPTREIERLMANCRISPDMTVEDVVKIALDFANALIEIYKEAARESDNPEARNIFLNLAEMEQRERQRFIRDAEWMQDL